MNHILDVSPDTKQLTAEPGVTVEQLVEEAGKLGLELPCLP